MAKKDTDLAIAQLIGFGHARNGYDVIHVVESMGLTAKEWAVIKDDVQGCLSGCGFDDFTEVEEYFQQA